MHAATEPHVKTGPDAATNGKRQQGQTQQLQADSQRVSRLLVGWPVQSKVPEGSVLQPASHLNHKGMLPVIPTALRQVGLQQQQVLCSDLSMHSPDGPHHLLIGDHLQG